MSLVGEMGTSVGTLRGLADFTRENQSNLILKVFQGVFGDLWFPFEAYTLLVLGSKTPSNQPLLKGM